MEMFQAEYLSASGENMWTTVSYRNPFHDLVTLTLIKRMWPMLLLKCLWTQSSVFSLCSTLLCGHLVYMCTVCVCVCVCVRAKGDVMFDDIMQTCRECRLVAVLFWTSFQQLSLTLPYRCVLPQPFIPLCQLCQCVSSRNSLKLTLISSASLPILAQIERGKNPPTHIPVSLLPALWLAPSAKSLCQSWAPASYGQCFFCLSPSMSPSVPAEPSPCSGQVGSTSRPPTRSPSNSGNSGNSSSGGGWQGRQHTSQRSWQDKEHTLPLEPHKGAGPTKAAPHTIYPPSAPYAGSSLCRTQKWEVQSITDSETERV